MNEIIITIMFQTLPTVVAVAIAGGALKNQISHMEKSQEKLFDRLHEMENDLTSIKVDLAGKT